MIVLRNLFEITSLFFISLIIFIWGLNANEVIGFESRFYLFVLEMWRDGASWFPTTYHEPYPDYPATSTFLIYIFAKLFGTNNKLIAVLPSAIAAAMTVTLTYLIGALQQKRWGVFAVFFLFCTFIFLKTARSIELDMYSAMITAACFYLIYSADLNHQSHRVYWVYPLLILGFAFRGPIGLILPTGVICSYYLVDGRFKKILIIGTLALLLLLACTTTLLFLAYLTGGKTFMHQVLHMQVLGRIDNAFLPFYFYFTNSIKSYALSFPLAALVLIGIMSIKGKNSDESQFLYQLFAWILIILLGMSIPGDKKIRYILPIIPATALLAAYFFVTAIKHHYFILIRHILMTIFLYLPILFLFAIGYFWYFHHQGIEAFINFSHIIFLSCAQLANFFIYFFYAQDKRLRDILIVFIATSTFVCMYIGIIEPLEMQVEKAKYFVQQMESERLQERAELVFYKEKPDGLPIKYLINATTHVEPIFIDNRMQLNQFKQKAFFITSQSYFAELSANQNLRVIAQDKLGHIPVIVFTKRNFARE